MTFKELWNETFQWFTLGAEHLFSGNFTDLSVGQVLFTCSFAWASTILIFTDFSSDTQPGAIRGMRKIPQVPSAKKT